MRRLALLSVLLTLPAQQPDPDAPLIRVTVNLVQVDAIVTDKSGHVVTDLAPDDFEILQDGKPRKISRFAYIAAQSGPTPLPARRANPNAVPIPPPSYKPEQYAGRSSWLSTIWPSALKVCIRFARPLKNSQQACSPAIWWR